MNKLKIFLIVILCFLVSRKFSSDKSVILKLDSRGKKYNLGFFGCPRYITLLPVLDGYYDSLEDQLSNHLKKNIKIFSNEKPIEISSSKFTKRNEDNSIKAMLNFECLEAGKTYQLKIIRFLMHQRDIFIARIKINSNDWEETIFTSTRKKNEFFSFLGKPTKFF